MQQRYPDGLPVNYLPSCNEATNQRRNCATQSTGNSTDLPSVDSYFIPSPAAQVTEVGHQAQQQASSSALFPMTINTSVPAYQNPQIRSASSSPQGVWPTPPSTTCEEDIDNYSYQGSPASGSRGIQPIVSCSGPSSSASPRSWSPQEAQHIRIHQIFFKESDNMSTYNMGSCHQLPHEEQLHSQMAASVYESNNCSSANLTTSAMSQPQMLSAAHSHLESNLAAVTQSESPQAEQGMEASYTSYSQDESSQEPGQGLEENEQESEKVDGPYAQLIHQAFMSRRTRAMTLQEIYQWFRENTDKEKTDKGNRRNGWQNSIRHNLSMNQAFVRRERKASSDDPLNGSGEAKKISQWVLEEWAVGGVQSTTRYRSKGTSNRHSKSRSSSRTNAHASARAMSGRKGGKKAAASKRAILCRKNTSSAFTPENNVQNIPGQMQNAAYEGMHYSLPTHIPSHTRGEPMTPPGHGHERMILESNAMQSMVLPEDNASHEFSFGPNVPQYSQASHHNMYTLNNVEGLFPGHQAAINVQGSQGLSSTMHSDFHPLFEDTEDNRSNRIPMHYLYQPGPGNQFQQ
ncbi:uncharacterized protein F4812DRAFT_462920 [Daldinia caldariorum]|uniref:uncharacterized protein n=1 Tax=Daldinia caldariorum TaxID=326644 RepID=UPI0020076170|nr:uncharacterized protein F4812DRAFT_462920 [Daldinia caldariorum]KAI1464170.1 hypothetical protein F4812DRAFT_462920 [Daldinia caldariorum]